MFLVAPKSDTCKMTNYFPSFYSHGLKKNMRNFPFSTYKVDSLLEELVLDLKHE